MATASNELPGDTGVADRYQLSWEQREVLEQADRFARLVCGFLAE